MGGNDAREVVRKPATDVALCRAIVFPEAQAKEIFGSWISPAGVVEGQDDGTEEGIHDLIFRGRATVRKREGSEE